MVGCFGLNDCHGNPYRVPLYRLTDDRPCVSVFELERTGLLREGVSATLRTAWGSTDLTVRTAGEILLDGQLVAIAPQPLPQKKFICGHCNHGCYKLYSVGGVWRCRKCHGLDYRSRHWHRSIPGFHRIFYLRRRIGAEQRLFAPIEPKTNYHVRYNRIAEEIVALETRLIDHLRRDVCDVVERRNEKRIAACKKQGRPQP